MHVLGVQTADTWRVPLRAIYEGDRLRFYNNPEFTVDMMKCIQNKQFRTLVVARTAPEAIREFEYAKYAIENNSNLKAWVSRTIRNPNEYSITFRNGSYMRFVGVEQTPEMRGYYIHEVVANVWIPNERIEWLRTLECQYIVTTEEDGIVRFFAQAPTYAYHLTDAPEGFDHVYTGTWRTAE